MSAERDRMSTLLATAYPPFSQGQIPQFEHRIQILKHLLIEPASHVLEIGCGQGDATIVLADAVGEHGHVTAVDPAPLDYGSPYTLGQAQTHVQSTLPLGARIDFVQSDPTTYVAGLLPTGLPGTLPQTAILIHSLWYFASRTQIATLFSTLASSPSIKRVLIAEHSLIASQASQLPHVLAARIQGALSVAGDPAANTGNIRTLVTPHEIIELAQQAGWILRNQGTFTPVETLQDGSWEVDEVVRPKFLEKIDAAFGHVVSENTSRDDIIQLRQELIATLGSTASEGPSTGTHKKKVRCMDTWWAEFGMKT